MQQSELSRKLNRTIDHLIRSDGFIKEAGVDGLGTSDQTSVSNAALQMPLTQSFLGNRHGPVGQHHADGNLVQADLEVSDRAHTNVAAQQEERTSGDRMTRASRHNRNRGGVGVSYQVAAIGHQIKDRLNVVATHNAQVEPARESAFSARHYDRCDGVIGRSLIDVDFQFCDCGPGEGVGLAVVQLHEKYGAVGYSFGCDHRGSPWLAGSVTRESGRVRPGRAMTLSTTTVYIIAGAAFLASWLVKRWLKTTYAKWSRIPNTHGVTGAQVAAAILQKNGVHHVVIQPTPGRLTDHYDPQKDILRLSAANFQEASVAAIAVSAHEAGHAMQDASNDIRLRLRRFLVPAAALGSRLGPMIVMAGLFTGSDTILRVGAFLLAGMVVFQIATLPVEFNASRRAMRNLRELGLTDPEQEEGIERVLTAAAFTYVAGAATTIAYFATLFAGRRSV